MKRLLTKEIKDPVAQENFKRIENAWRQEPLLKGRFKFFEITFEAASYPATVGYPHRLGFLPKDVITTRSTPGVVAWKYDDFTAEEVFAEVWFPTTVRCFIGTYAESRTE